MKTEVPMTEPIEKLRARTYARLFTRAVLGGTRQDLAGLLARHMIDAIKAHALTCSGPENPDCNLETTLQIPVKDREWLLRLHTYESLASRKEKTK